MPTETYLPMLRMWRELLNKLADVDAHPTDRDWRTSAEVVKSLAEQEYNRWLTAYMNHPTERTPSNG